MTSTFELTSETKFRATVQGFDLWVTAQEDGKHFGSIRPTGERSWMDIHCGNFDSQSDAVKYLTNAISREVAAAQMPLRVIKEGDIAFTEEDSELHTVNEIMDAAFKSPHVYAQLQAIHAIIANESNWKLPVRIRIEGDFPSQWVEATTGWFSGCVSGHGLYRVQEWNMLYSAGYYAMIGA